MSVINKEKAIEMILADKVDLNENSVLAALAKVTGDAEKFETLNMTCDRHAAMLREMPDAANEVAKDMYELGFAE